MKKAFTLAEILIVVAILGILAAIALPTFQSHVLQAREAAAKDDLRILRNVIELYAVQHNCVPPGYENGNMQNDPHPAVATAQITNQTNVLGQYDQPGSPGYNYGPYLKVTPDNPFTTDNRIYVIMNDAPFPTEQLGDLGWLYKPQTKEVRLNWDGVDSKGVPYFDY